jgi:murein DD-endopeptidase MepM/ murein hydrolase activator NlpD
MMVAVCILKYLQPIKYLKYSLFLFLCINLLSVSSQNNKLQNLKKKRIQYQNDINNAKKLLVQKGSSRKNSLAELTLLTAQIDAQNSVINNYKEEIEAIDGIINTNTEIVNKLSNEINIIKKGYENLIIEANKHYRINYNEFMLLFSSKSFSEAYRRFQLMKQYSSYRKKQGQLLENTRNIHDSIIIVNTNIRRQKRIIIISLRNELSNIKSNITKKQLYVAKLKKEEDWLKKEIRKKEKASLDLQSSIKKLLAEAKRKSTEYGFSNFVNAKGHLNWPVHGGIVTSTFGEHNHAVLKGVKIKNNGIDITVAKDKEVKCVYEGSVSRVIAIPGYNKAVIIRHGKYLTVYANLAQVFVKNGQSLTSNQSIGKIYSDESENNGVLHFELWENNKKINPLHWLQK